MLVVVMGCKIVREIGQAQVHLPVKSYQEPIDS